MPGSVPTSEQAGSPAPDGLPAQSPAPGAWVGEVLRRRGRAVVWLLFALVSASLLGRGDWLPLYDYYQWLFQGHVLAGLLFGAGGDSGALSTLYSVRPVPVPNLAAPFAIAALDTVLPIEVAGRVFLVLGVLAFASSYAFLVRSVQQRPTAVEFTGFFWVFGFFLYKGYVSYLFGLPLAFLVIGLLHRRVVHGARPLGRGVLLGVAVLQTLLYLSHLLAFAVAFLATAVYCGVLARRGSRRQAARLGCTVLPAVVLGAWYVLAEHGGTGLGFYSSPGDKAVSLVEPLLPFLTLEPFPSPFPSFLTGVLCLLVLGAAVAVNVDWPGVRGGRGARPILVVAGVLAAAAVLIPVDVVNDLIRPDERFTLPAVLLVLAALPLRPARLLRTLPVVGVVAVVLGLHSVEYAAVAPDIAAIDRAGDRVIPGESPVLYVSVDPSSCARASGPSIRVPALKWFGVDRALEEGPLQVNIDQTSLVVARPDAGGPEGLTVVASDLADLEAQTLRWADQYPYLEVLGCPSDLARVGARLGPGFEQEAAGRGFRIFSRTAAG